MSLANTNIEIAADRNKMQNDQQILASLHCHSNTSPFTGSSASTVC